MLDWARVLPPDPKSTGTPLVPFCALVLIAIAGTVRSLIHMFAHDGGAASIAGLAVGGAGGRNLVAIFAQWGASQLILAIIQWAVILRYRALTPLMLLVVVVEQLLRLGMGYLKPLDVSAPPPGAIGTYVLLAVAAVMLVWSLWPARAPGR